MDRIARAVVEGTDEGQGGRLTNAERVKLLFGPYQAPPLNRGDRAVCLFRDCEVVITGRTDARMSARRGSKVTSDSTP
jgi:hypothetical protein